MDKLDGKSKDIVGENILKLKELFPEAFTEDGSADYADGCRLGKKIDFEVLKELLGEYVSVKNERYSFTWNGKSRDDRTNTKHRHPAPLQGRISGLGYHTESFH